jgi:hypothetical protein
MNSQEANCSSGVLTKTERDGKERAARAKVALVAVLFRLFYGAAIRNHALQKGQRFQAGCIIKDVGGTGLVDNVAAPAKGEGGEAGGVNGVDVAQARALDRGVGEWVFDGGAGHLAELVPGLGRAVVAQLGQPILVVVHHLHGLVGRPTVTGLELRQVVGGQRNGKEIAQFRLRVAPLFALYVGVNRGQHVLYSISSSLVLVGHRHARKLVGWDAGDDLLI